MVGGLDPKLIEIVLLSLRVSLTAVVCATPARRCRSARRSRSGAFPAAAR